MEKREYNRKLLDPIHVTNVQAIDRLMILAGYGTVLNASATGLLIEVQRCDVGPELQEHTLTLETVKGEDVTMEVVEMSLHIEGTIIRTHETARGSYEIAIDFAASAPAYWRECFAELLPQRGEFNQMERAPLN